MEKKSFKNVVLYLYMNKIIYENLSKSDIDNFWTFIKIFTPNNLEKDSLYSPHKYRNYLIKTIQKKYTVNEFYKNERILNELLFNLMKKYDFYLKQNNKKEKYSNIININSFSHKLLLYHEKTKKLYFNYKNAPNLYFIASLLRNRDTFENAMTDINFIKSYNYEHYFYADDYAFPNVNLVFYNDNSKKLWIKNIKRLYYVDNCEENWRINPYISVEIDSLII
jgi:hypothetical protein